MTAPISTGGHMLTYEVRAIGPNRFRLAIKAAQGYASSS